MCCAGHEGCRGTSAPRSCDSQAIRGGCALAVPRQRQKTLDHSAAPLQNTRQTDLVGSLGLKSDRLLASEAFGGGPDIGTVAPDLELIPSTLRLFDLMDGRFTCLVWGGIEVGDAAAAQLLRDLDKQDSLVQVISMPENDLFDARLGTVYLLRPDHHVVARWRSVDVGTILATVRHSMGHDSADSTTSIS